MTNGEYASAEMSNKVFVLSGPSGVGKSSLIRELVRRMDELQLSISHTTRKPRASEENGKEYHFVSAGEFDELIAKQGFLEFAEVFGHHYGTSKESIDRQMRSGKAVVMEIDWQGARSIRKCFSNTISIFILPASKDDLHQRLVGRGQDREEVIEERMEQAMSEMEHYDEFDYCLVNADFETACSTLEDIIRNGKQSDESRHKAQQVLADLNLA